jgi:hypothetical protein
MEEMIAKDPSLLEKDSSFFHEQVSSELERQSNQTTKVLVLLLTCFNRAGIYNTIRENVLNTLEEDYYQQRVDKEVHTVTEKVDNK